MAINAAAASYRLVPKYKPQFTAATLAEIQPAVDAAPATYEGKYIVALDQAAGLQLYYVESGVVVPAHEQAAHRAELDDDRFYNADGSLVTDAIGVQWFSGVTDANGQLTVQATVDGTGAGAALFTAIKAVSIQPEGIGANVIDRVFPGGYTITNGKTILCQVMRGATVLLGGASVRTAPAGITVRVRVEGTL